MKLGYVDYIVFILYGIVIVSIGLWVSRKKKGRERTAKDYFLANKSLPWWAIGASLIAANISAEQIIGMSGSGFAIGLAIASYEWMSAITLIIVGKYFLPVFIKKGIFTIPEFVEKRFGSTLKTILAVFWLSLFIFVNLTTVLFLGGTALDTIIGNGDGTILTISIIGIALFAAIYSLWGGLSAVAWTDVIQVVLLILGGIITTVVALGKVLPDQGIIDSIKYVFYQIPEKFSLILHKGELITPGGQDAWWDLPGLAVLIGGLWVANLYYWGFNQYIIQRTFAAKSLKESQKGIAFAAYLKLFIPLIVVIPGLVAYVLNSSPSGINVESIDSMFIKDNTIDTLVNNIDNDKAYPWLIRTISESLPVGVIGLLVAALTAAIVSSIASMLNSTSTIFTMDIYAQHINRKANEKQKVTVGRITVAVALIIACLITPLLKSLDQVFQYIQEYTGMVSPAILAVFILGLFWKKTTNKSAIVGSISGICIAFFLKVGKLGIANGTMIENLFPILPFMHQMTITFLLVIVIMMTLSYIELKGGNDSKGIVLTKQLFKTDFYFNLNAVIIIIVLILLYYFFW